MERQVFDTLTKVEYKQLQDLSGALETGAGRILMRAVELMLEKERDTMESRPLLGGEDVTKSVQYRLGAIGMARRILALPDGAREYLDGFKEKLP